MITKASRSRFYSQGQFRPHVVIIKAPRSQFYKGAILGHSHKGAMQPVLRQQQHQSRSTTISVVIMLASRSRFYSRTRITYCRDHKGFTQPFQRN